MVIGFFKKSNLLFFLFTLALLSSVLFSISLFSDPVSARVSHYACLDKSSVCGGPLDSTLGYGAIDMCNSCFICGVADGYCPEDFFSFHQGISANCSLCPDPDCHASLNVTVLDDHSNAVGGAIIDVDYHQQTVSVPSKRSTVSGNALFGAYSGSHVTITVSKANYVTLSKDVSVVRGETLNVTFTNFSVAPCLPDCTRGDGRCHADCDGVGGCEYSSNVSSVSNDEVSAICNNKAQGDLLFVRNVQNRFFYANCCGGPVYETIRPFININDYQNESIYSIETLVNHVQSVRFNGEHVFLVSTVFGTVDN